MGGLLHKNGITLGRPKDFIPKADGRNPKGYFENHTFRVINDKLLSYSGYRVKKWGLNPPTVLSVNEQDYKRMREVVEFYSDLFSEPWGWRDPRMCLTLGAWSTILQDLGLSYKLVVTKRNYNQIGKSLNRAFKVRVDQGAQLAKMYYESFDLALQKHKVPVYYSNYDLLLDQPQDTAKRLSEFLEHPIDDLSFLDRGLRHFADEN